MTDQDNRELVRRFIADIMSVGRMDHLLDFFQPGSTLAGGISGQMQSLRTAFPDSQFTIEDMVADDDRVAVRLTQNATHSGPLLGLPAFGRLDPPIQPTGNTIVVTSTMFFTISDGKIVSLATELDQISLLRQMGWTFTPPQA